MTDYQRLQKLMELLKISSIAELSRETDINAQTFYDIRKGNIGISKSVAEKINSKFPQFSVAWLLAGDDSSQIIGDNNNWNNVNTDTALLKAIEAISEQQEITKKSQEQIDKLLTIIEKLSL